MLQGEKFYYIDRFYFSCSWTDQNDTPFLFLKSLALFFIYLFIFFFLKVLKFRQMRLKIVSLVLMCCLHRTDICKCIRIVCVMVLFFILEMKPWISGIRNWTANHCTVMFGVSIMGFAVILRMHDFHALIHVMWYPRSSNAVWITWCAGCNCFTSLHILCAGLHSLSISIIKCLGLPCEHFFWCVIHSRLLPAKSVCASQWF
jgi:hypothetical protein